jgi:hypothetical protein
MAGGVCRRPAYSATATPAARTPMAARRALTGLWLAAPGAVMSSRYAAPGYRQRTARPGRRDQAPAACLLPVTAGRRSPPWPPSASTSGPATAASDSPPASTPPGRHPNSAAPKPPATPAMTKTRPQLGEAAPAPAPGAGYARLSRPVAAGSYPHAPDRLSFPSMPASPRRSAVPGTPRGWLCQCFSGARASSLVRHHAARNAKPGEARVTVENWPKRREHDRPTAAPQRPCLAWMSLLRS